MAAQSVKVGENVVKKAIHCALKTIHFFPTRVTNQPLSFITRHHTFECPVLSFSWQTSWNRITLYLLQTNSSNQNSTSSLLQPVAYIVFGAVRDRFFFISIQISMSVLRIQVRVMKMQIARTMKVLTAALVNRDLLEMERFVKVYTMLLLDKHYFSYLQNLIIN